MYIGLVSTLWATLSVARLTTISVVAGVGMQCGEKACGENAWCGVAVKFGGTRDQISSGTRPSELLTYLGSHVL